MIDSIANGVTEDGYKWSIFRDDYYDYEPNFKIYATQGTAKYLKVDKVLDPDDMDSVSKELKSDDVLHFAPLYLYVHSGMSISLMPFGDKWDSGQCGFAVLTKDDAHWRGITEENYSNALHQAVTEFDAVLRGNVYAWTIEKTTYCDTCKNSNSQVIDSLGGIIVTSMKELDTLVRQDIDSSIQMDREKRMQAENPKEVLNGAD